MNNKRGFTLMEIAVTVIILGVLSALAIPNLSSSVERSRTGEGIQILNELLSAQRIFRFEDGTNYAANLASLDVTIPTPANFIDPPLVDNNVNRVASVRRIGGAYTLCINSIGVITCAGSCAVTGIAAGANCSNP